MAKNKNCNMCGDSPSYNYKKLGTYYCEKHYRQILKNGKIKNRTIRDKNEIIIKDNSAIIYLYNKEGEKIAEALIDIEDVDRVKNYKWRLSYGYANNRMTGISLQNLIMNFTSDGVYIIDHINRNRLDCKKSNLRLVNYTVNGYNKGKQSNNTSGYPGIIWNKHNKNWNVNIKINGKTIRIGTFKGQKDAIEARQKGELQYFGEIINRKHDINTIYKKDEKSK